MTARDTEVLRKLIEDKKFLKERSTQEKVAKDYGQTVLKEMYKPLLAGQESQLKETQSITQKQSEAARQKEIINQQQHQELVNEIKRQPLIVPLIKSLNNYPNVIAVIMGEMSEYDLNGVEQGVFKELAHVDDRILRTLITYYSNKVAMGSPISESGIETASTSEHDKPLPEVEIESPYLTGVDLHSKPEDYTDEQYGEALYMYYGGKPTHQDISDMSETAIYKLSQYLNKHPEIIIDGRKSPWWQINKVHSNFINNIRVHQKGGKKSSGKGVKFLSSNPTELLNKLDLLIAEKEAGNTNVLSEATAIVDELRRLGVLTIAQIKKIYNLIR